MSTFGTMKSRVSTEMLRGDLSISSTAVQSSILSAIARLERKRFYFNEFHDASLTSSGTYAPLSGMSITPVVIDTIKAVINTRDYPLVRATWREIDNIDAGQYTGYPDYYVVQGENIRLYPPPNSDYILKIAGVKKLPEISVSATPSASNAWMTDGEEMVRCLAKSFLFRDHLRNPEMATYFAAESKKAEYELCRETRGKASAGKLRLTRF